MNRDSHNRLAARQGGHVGDTAHTPGHANDNNNDYNHRLYLKRVTHLVTN